MWDLDSSTIVASLKDHHKPVTQLALHAGSLITVSGGVVRVFETAAFRCVHQLKASAYSGAIKSFCISSEGHIYLGSQVRSGGSRCCLKFRIRVGARISSGSQMRGGGSRPGLLFRDRVGVSGSSPRLD